MSCRLWTVSWDWGNYRGGPCEFSLHLWNSVAPGIGQKVCLFPDSWSAPCQVVPPLDPAFRPSCPRDCGTSSPRDCGTLTPSFPFSHRGCGIFCLGVSSAGSPSPCDEPHSFWGTGRRFDPRSASWIGRDSGFFAAFPSPSRMCPSYSPWDFWSGLPSCFFADCSLGHSCDLWSPYPRPRDSPCGLCVVGGFLNAAPFSSPLCLWDLRPSCLWDFCLFFHWHFSLFYPWDLRLSSYHVDARDSFCGWLP